ncbi:MAG: DUF5110 domain-containing protein [Bacteroidota bacterium]|nr:DUF5110 domain-containing protein [Bacteroidota bacterium]
MRSGFHLSLCIFFAALLSPVVLGMGNNPVADAHAVVLSGEARFTVLTPQLIRMEWSLGKKFQNYASLVFINRNLPVPDFTASEDNGWLVLRTKNLTLKYKKKSGKFSKNNLQISFVLNGKEIVWHPGMKDTANLRGTTRTLDGVEGPTSLEPGLLSRDGWTVVDDSERPLFDNSDWQWVMPRSGSSAEQQDWYFFGYGHEYKKALFDYTRVAGKIPMPPRFAFGLWWSRYWAYTDEEFKDLVRQFHSHDVPLDVLVIDMDWHQTFHLRWGKQPTDQAGQPLGWTGYTWDKNFFPAPAGFLKWCDEQGLKTPLNLHPASGIQPHEEHYPEMARAMGIDPATKKYVPFDIVDKKFASNYMNIMIHPLEKQGVDFWWLDWQQWGTTKITGVTPTWWLNYVFFTDMEREGKSRPLLFHRWGGLGNHRYEIGFSGDVISVWKSLAFQPYFTATAANVGYGYWSHDIGGHMPGIISPELYTRWIEWGIFSPIIRTHTTKNPNAERRLWAYPPDYFEAMRKMILLRYAMIPYIYTASREAYDTGISICRPMYYDYPEEAEAYDFRGEYMFGDNLLVAPIAEPVDSMSLLAAKKIWLPKGEWIEWFTGAHLHGPAIIERHFPFDEVPLYVKAGSIIPMEPKMRNTHEKPVDPLILTIFPGDSGATRMYEDEGNTDGYQRGECAWTKVSQKKIDARTSEVEIFPVEGNYPGMLKERSYEIRLRCSWPPEKVSCNGKLIAYSPEKIIPSWKYDGDHFTTVISLPKFKRTEKIELAIIVPEEVVGKDSLLNGMQGELKRLHTAMMLLNNQWPKDWSPDTLIHAVQTGNRIGIRPKTIVDELTALHNSMPEVIAQMKRTDIDGVWITRAFNHLSFK